MTTDLPSELRRLADESGPATPPGDLWRRGVRRGRRTRAATALATAAVVVAAVVVATAGWDSLRSADALPVADTSVPAIPDRLGAPSKWLPGTAEDGPIGPLAAITGAERGSFWSLSSRSGMVGVSATTGQYRFLDLPGAFQDLWSLDATPPTLSPNGRWVAYWLHHPDRPDWVGGFAAYDTVTGEVTEENVESELGIAVDALDWVSAGTVMASYGTVTERRENGWAAERDTDVLWTPGDGRMVEAAAGPTGGNVWPVPDGHAFPGFRNIITRDNDRGERVGSTRLRGSGKLQALAVDPSGRTVLGFVASSGLRRPVVAVGDLGEGPTQMREVRTDLDLLPPALGWVDSSRVVVRGWDADDVVGAYAVDVRAGEHSRLVREDRVRVEFQPDYAAQLWQTPTVSRPGPDRFVDPRLRAISVGAAALALVWGALFMGRRRAST